MLKLKEKYRKLREQRGRMVLSVWLGIIIFGLAVWYLIGYLIYSLV